MANIFNLDFRDFLQALRHQQVKYILVGGYSVILHGYSRTTGDMDVWVEKTSENYSRLERAFLEFGMPTFDMTSDNFLNNSNFDVFTFGRQPVAIDIITAIKGLEFKAAFEQAKDIEVEGLVIRLIHYNDLIKAKKAAGRPRDINDIDHLTRK
ncbi:nucleotidyltransferase [Spirosoma sp. KUDC1026]|uniref:nucleotidyltransferase n=1 Tax=Spirosoma sp. KUDC1026 TaxID=2745947 RepID=UPI00159BD7AB|nr:nucleotidyltransferase [Spirosoma sp. KUDC1026]QKZ12861.1 nucleotidyltransferase [Spirosoma sp. KUDC1026]